MWLGPLLIALTLFGISRLFGAQHLAAIYREKFPETPRERLFWGSLGFFVAVAVVRTLTFLIHNQIGPFHDIDPAGREVGLRQRLVRALLELCGIKDVLSNNVEIDRTQINSWEDVEFRRFLRDLHAEMVRRIPAPVILHICGRTLDRIGDAALAREQHAPARAHMVLTSMPRAAMSVATRTS